MVRAAVFTSWLHIDSCLTVCRALFTFRACARTGISTKSIYPLLAAAQSSFAMLQLTAKANFTHMIRRYKHPEHQLVTWGMYRWASRCMMPSEFIMRR